MKERYSKKERGRYVREIWPYGELWCDRCRSFIENLAAHQHR